MDKCDAVMAQVEELRRQQDRERELRERAADELKVLLKGGGVSQAVIEETEKRLGLVLTTLNAEVMH